VNGVVVMPAVREGLDSGEESVSHQNLVVNLVRVIYSLIMENATLSHVLVSSLIVSFDGHSWYVCIHL